MATKQVKTEDQTGYFVCRDRAVRLPGKGQGYLSEFQPLLKSHGYTEQHIERLAAAGWIKKGRGDSPVSIFSGDHMGPMLGKDQVFGEEPNKVITPTKENPNKKTWVFTDDDLKGMDLNQLNALIVRNGGKAQPDQESAVEVLQSEL